MDPAKFAHLRSALESQEKLLALHQCDIEEVTKTFKTVTETLTSLATQIQQLQAPSAVPLLVPQPPPYHMSLAFLPHLHMMGTPTPVVRFYPNALWSLNYRPHPPYRMSYGCVHYHPPLQWDETIGNSLVGCSGALLLHLLLI